MLSFSVDYDSRDLEDVLAPAGTFTGPPAKSLSEKGKAIMRGAIHEYSPGYFVDALDYWKDRSGLTRRTWRKAEVVDVTDTQVTVLRCHSTRP